MRGLKSIMTAPSAGVNGESVVGQKNGGRRETLGNRALRLAARDTGVTAPECAEPASMAGVAAARCALDDLVTAGALLRDVHGIYYDVERGELPVIGYACAGKINAPVNETVGEEFAATRAARRARR